MLTLRLAAGSIFPLVLVLASSPAGLVREKTFTYKQPFSLQGIGVGPNPVQGELVLKAEDEEPFVSRVLLQTIQGFHLSLPDRPQNATEPLLPRRDYKTDMVPLSDEEVRMYNAAIAPQLALDRTLNYALQYGIRYEIHVERERYFSARSFHRSALTAITSSHNSSGISPKADAPAMKGMNRRFASGGHR